MVNVQHDCRTGKCKPTGTKQIYQEREETTRTVATLNHSDDRFFIINLHALHNAALLRQTLPRYLTAPKPLHVDRRDFHDKLALELQSTQQAKRDRTKAKSAATRQANKRKKQIAEGRSISKKGYREEKSEEVGADVSEHSEMEEDEALSDRESDEPELLAQGDETEDLRWSEVRLGKRRRG